MVFRPEIQLRALGNAVSPQGLLSCSSQAAGIAPSQESALAEEVSVNTFLRASLVLGIFQSVEPQHVRLVWDSPSQSLGSFSKPCPPRAAALIVLCLSPPL